MAVSRDEEIDDLIAAVRALLAMRKVLWAAIVLTFVVASGGAAWMTNVTMEQRTQSKQLGRIEDKLIDDLQTRITKLERLTGPGVLPRARIELDELRGRLRALEAGREK